LEFYGLLLSRTAGGHLWEEETEVGFDCAFLSPPKILLLDEPTTGVDPISRREFWKILYDLVAQKVTIVIATPYMDEAERAGRVAFLYKGRVLKCAAPESLRREYPYQLAEVVTDDLHIAKTLLEKRFGAGNVTFFGDKLHLKTADYRSLSETIRGFRRIANPITVAGANRAAFRGCIH
jgi:ABC-2 type transport system ATP-binding protein